MKVRSERTYRHTSGRIADKPEPAWTEADMIADLRMRLDEAQSFEMFNTRRCPEPTLVYDSGWTDPVKKEG